MKALAHIIAVFTVAATAPLAWAIPADQCPLVSVTTCYVQPSASPLVNCCNEWAPGQYCFPYLYWNCCDSPDPDSCGCTTGHLYGRAIGSVAVKDEPGCENFAFIIRTGWMTWYQEYDEWFCNWFNFQWVDQIIVKNRGEPPTTYDHTVHLYEPPWAPYPCEYWKFQTQIGNYYERCCTILTR
jgi:hypothetical protein